ncbi:MAG TPA: hypothetical protein VNR40_13535, partial [Steroidobacter sp.]|nr:hypothetical protein [Steroidobacter sp.]
MSGSYIRNTLAALMSLWLSAAAVAATQITESYEPVPMPPGFQVVVSELEGPVFANAKGHTLYQWPVKPLRNGAVGERKGQPTCDSTRYQVN